MVGDCKAFFAGRLADVAGRHGAPVPMWVWTNLLAHGSTNDLVRAVASGRRTRRGPAAWRHARALLAEEVLQLAAETGSLVEVQRQLLVRLGLDLSCRPEVGAWTPDQWAAIVLRALEPHRRELATS